MPSDLSPLLFRPPNADQSSLAQFTFIGPVKVSSSDVIHGRGLIATRDINPGECLFVTPPTVSANIGEVKRLWSGSNGKRSIEEVAEASLLKSMKRSIKAKDKATAISFMALTSVHSDAEIDVPDIGQYGASSSTDVLLGRCEEVSALKAIDERRANDKDELLGIVRHNAFGPDYHNYSRIEQTWMATSSPDPSPYSRILGMYPLAAIINHSCTSNAVRVFSGEAMAVHANAPIKEGEEIVWSYLPPAQPYHARQEQTRGKYGFCCRCKRCILENEALEAAPHVWEGLKALDYLNETGMSTATIPKPEKFDDFVETVEKLLADPLLSNEASRSLRLGYSNLFINFFNTALSSNVDRSRILSLATNLHFAFASFHNASTEHLSILHLCYELAATTSSTSTSTNGSSAAGDSARKKIAFWTDQLKRAHMVRYGELGNDVASVREAMKHTRGILRNLDGLQRARWGFI